MEEEKGLTTEETEWQEEDDSWEMPQSKRQITLSHVAGICIAGLLLLCLILWLVRFAPEKKSAGLVINEVVTDNRGCYTDPSLGMPHWVELYNGSDHDINLEGYGLSDNPKQSERFLLPEVTIPAGGYLLVFFMGGTPQADDNPLCTGFGLSHEESRLFLTGANRYLLDEIEVPLLGANQAYARVNGSDFVVTNSPTPASENVFENLGNPAN